MALTLYNKVTPAVSRLARGLITGGGWTVGKQTSKPPLRELPELPELP